MRAQKLGTLAKVEVSMINRSNSNMKAALKEAVAHCINMWANGTRDHAYELTASPILSAKVNKLIGQLRSKLLYVGNCVPQSKLSVCTFKNVEWIRNKIGEIAHHIDRHFLKIKGADRGQWR